VTGPEAPLGSEHNVRSVGGQTRGLARWLQSVSAHSAVGKTIMSLSRCGQTSFGGLVSRRGQASPTSSRRRKCGGHRRCI